MTWGAGMLADLPLILAAAGVPFVALAVLAGRKVSLAEVWLPLAAVSLLGAVAGIAGGNSRTGVVGDVIPAALALVGTVSIYVFGAKPDRAAIVATTAAAFALALGLGYAAGAGKRGPAEAAAQNYVFCERLFSEASLYADAGRLARASDIFGAYCGNAFGLSHDRTVSDPDAKSTIGFFRSRFEAARDRGIGAE